MQSVLGSLTIPQPEEPLQSTGSKLQLMTQLKTTVDDEYLEFGCRRVLTENDLRDSGKNLNQGLIVVGIGGLTPISWFTTNADSFPTGARVDFPVFMRAGHSTSLIYAGSGVVIGAPSMIVGLVEDKAQEIVRGGHGIEQVDISTLGVYEVRFSSIYWDGNC